MFPAQVSYFVHILHRFHILYISCTDCIFCPFPAQVAYSVHILHRLSILYIHPQVAYFVHSGTGYIFCKYPAQVTYLAHYNAFNVYCRELAPGTVSLTGDRAQGDDSKH